MRTLVAVHGAWSAGWAWRKMKPLLREYDLELIAPTLTGLGERAHLLAPSVGLETHVQDITAMLEMEELSGVVLLGHSYGGMVVTGVADRVPERIRQLIYLDAFVPENGQCVFDLLPPQIAGSMRARVTNDGEGWMIQPNPLPPDTSEEDRAWILPRRGPQSLATHEEKLCLRSGQAPSYPRAYIYCLRAGSGDVFGPTAACIRSQKEWTYREIDASHSPHVTAPAALAVLLLALCPP
ncbi:MAG TPA: alpha/beta hydrolase [Mesorhizobium sp.]|jgi:pimeloyl-ACP methyl ester carboxylesterase|nr:alpha/beta hydrolase [Mesorhizobium sp.]